MAQSALTVTPPNPTPPTNMSCTGATPPNPPNYTKNTYIDWAPDTDFDTDPPPYFDDGAAGSLAAFATNTAALASRHVRDGGRHRGQLSGRRRRDAAERALQRRGPGQHVGGARGGRHRGGV